MSEPRTSFSFIPAPARSIVFAPVFFVALPYLAWLREWSIIHLCIFSVAFLILYTLLDWSGRAFMLIAYSIVFILFVSLLRTDWPAWAKVLLDIPLVALCIFAVVGFVISYQQGD